MRGQDLRVVREQPVPGQGVAASGQEGLEVGEVSVAPPAHQDLVPDDDEPEGEGLSCPGTGQSSRSMAPVTLALSGEVRLDQDSTRVPLRSMRYL